MIFTRDDGAEQTRATLVLTGDIDMASEPALRHVTANLPLRELERLTVDLADVPFMDSTGVGFLVALRKRMSAHSELLVVNAQPIVARVLRLTGVDRIVGPSEAPVASQSVRAQTSLDAIGGPVG